MAGFTLEQHIARPPAEVFAFATDLEQVRTWMPAIVRCEVVGGGPVAAGATLSETRLMGRRECTAEITIDEHAGPAQRPAPPYVHAAGSAAMGVQCRYHYTFADDGAGGTDVTMVCTARATNPLGYLIAPLLAKVMRKADGDQLERLAAALGRGR